MSYPWSPETGETCRRCFPSFQVRGDVLLGYWSGRFFLSGLFTYCPEIKTLWSRFRQGVYLSDYLWGVFFQRTWVCLVRLVGHLTGWSLGDGDRGNKLFGA